VDRSRIVQQTVLTAVVRTSPVSSYHRRRRRRRRQHWRGHCDRRDFGSSGSRRIQRLALSLTAGSAALYLVRRLNGGDGVGHAAGGENHKLLAVVHAGLTAEHQRHAGEDCWPVWKDLTTANETLVPGHDDDQSSPQTRRRSSSPTDYRCCRELSL